jgi:TPR repeat protein
LSLFLSPSVSHAQDYQYHRKDVADDKEAFSAVLDEVKLGNTRLLNLLGYFFERGIGVERNLAEAVRLYKYSSDQGMRRWLFIVVRFLLLNFFPFLSCFSFSYFLTFSKM